MPVNLNFFFNVTMFCFYIIIYEEIMRSPAYILSRLINVITSHPHCVTLPYLVRSETAIFHF